MNFFDAFNRGDQAQLAKVVLASKDRNIHPSRWYSVTESDPQNGGNHFVAYDTDKLLRYFAQRHQQHERLSLLMVEVAYRGNGVVDFVYALKRQTDDIEPGPEGLVRNIHGKGAIDCGEQKIRTWSMAMSALDDPDSRTVYWPACPRPSGWKPGTPVVACARTH